MKPAGSAPPAAPAEVRLDVWLDVACLFKTRSEAQKACRGGKVDLNGQSGKPHRPLHVGDQLRITRAAGRRQQILVKALAEQHLPKAEARLLYEDVTPPPTPEELALRELERHFWKARRTPAPVAPDRRERRRVRREKEGGDSGFGE
ncbi:MAG TPA: RNA-binding S4 domain-containing protein [Vicinamibacterales bacterium]|nr:RNA-binding S4 domain-containing protein [Vicinamibacterales bacterium]